MPLREVRAFIAELPRVEAIESLLVVERLGIGTNQVRASDRSAALRRWREEAGVRPRRVKDAAMHGHLAAAAGFQVRTVRHD